MNSRHVLLVYGADRLPFTEDLEQAEKRGIVAHALELPENRGHPVDGCRDHYDAVSDIIAAEAHTIRQNAGRCVIAAIGRNLGGSLLAYYAARHNPPDIVVITGAIPDLARFRAESGHPGARGFRERITDPDKHTDITTLADLDLVSTLGAIPHERCLLQVGTADPWIDNESWTAYDKLEKSGFAVERLADDHAMVSDDALERRWTFIEQMS